MYFIFELSCSDSVYDDQVMLVMGNGEVKPFFKFLASILSTERFGNKISL